MAPHRVRSHPEAGINQLLDEYQYIDELEGSPAILQPWLAMPSDAKTLINSKLRSFLLLLPSFGAILVNVVLVSYIYVKCRGVWPLSAPAPRVEIQFNQVS